MAAKGKGKDKTEEYRKLFKKADSNGDGYLTIREFRDVLQRGGSKMCDREIADTFVFFDGPKGDRSITEQEFINGLERINAFVEALHQLFVELDKDGSGSLDREELTTLLQRCDKQYTDAEIAQILRDADKNKDNKISFKEFVDACT